jgi:hypothetical protein
LLDDAAPVTAEKFMRALPIHEQLRHVRWSGEAGYVLVSSLQDSKLALENRMSFFCRGTIGFRPEHGEVAIAYGSAQARDWWGIGWASRVAELEGDPDDFLAAIMRTQREGKMNLVIDAEKA